MEDPADPFDAAPFTMTQNVPIETGQIGPVRANFFTSDPGPPSAFISAPPIAVADANGDGVVRVNLKL